MTSTSASWKSGIAAVAIVAAAIVSTVYPGTAAQVGAAVPVPQFKLDATWPKRLPHSWQMGAVTSVYVDRHDVVWTTNQSNRLNANDRALEIGEGLCCTTAPQVIAFNQGGDVVKSWYTAGDQCKGKGYRCFDGDGLHSVYVDARDNVWVTGRGGGDSHVLKFDYEGKFLLQIGGDDKEGCCGNQDPDNLGGGTGMAFWPATNEIFVTDGYVNRRVVVYDATTGKFKRMWGAYGHQPPQSSLTSGRGGPGQAGGPPTMTSEEPERRFEGEGAKEWSTVHGVAITPDGVVWIADRVGNRMQQFRIDGTYIREAFVARPTKVASGTVYGFAFSRDPQMAYVYVTDGSNKRVHILDRQTLREVGFVGGTGGQLAGSFYHLHGAATDLSGNLYTAEAAGNARLQRFNLLNANGRTGPGYGPDSDTFLVN